MRNLLPLVLPMFEQFTQQVHPGDVFTVIFRVQRLELDEVHMEGVGIFRQSENRPPGCPFV